MFINVSAGSVLTGDVVVNEETCCLTRLIQSVRSQADKLGSTLWLAVYSNL